MFKIFSRSFEKYQTKRLSALSIFEKIFFTADYKINYIIMLNAAINNDGSHFQNLTFDFLCAPIQKSKGLSSSEPAGQETEVLSGIKGSFVQPRMLIDRGATLSALHFCFFICLVTIFRQRLLYCPGGYPAKKT